MIICPHCKRENEDHYKFCLGCGTEISRADAGPDGPPAARPVVAAPPRPVATALPVPTALPVSPPVATALPATTALPPAMVLPPAAALPAATPPPPDADVPGLPSASRVAPPPMDEASLAGDEHADADVFSADPARGGRRP
ncbi:MAG: hypothetical protein R3F60_33570 [bacterium]